MVSIVASSITARRAGLVHQLGWAHGGAPGARRQHALAEGGEEDGIDQLGFAARKLGDEGDIQFVVAQRATTLVEALVDLVVGKSWVPSQARKSVIEPA